MKKPKNQLFPTSNKSRESNYQLEYPKMRIGEKVELLNHDVLSVNKLQSS